jgi:hypothetical protein
MRYHAGFTTFNSAKVLFPNVCRFSSKKMCVGLATWIVQVLVCPRFVGFLQYFQRVGLDLLKTYHACISFGSEIRADMHERLEWPQWPPCGCGARPEWTGTQVQGPYRWVEACTKGIASGLERGTRGWVGRWYFSKQRWYGWAKKGGVV